MRFFIIDPVPSDPEPIHAAHRQAKFAFQHEEAMHAELAAARTEHADELTIERKRLATETAEDRTEDKISLYLDALRDARRPETARAS